MDTYKGSKRAVFVLKKWMFQKGQYILNLTPTKFRHENVRNPLTRPELPDLKLLLTFDLRFVGKYQ